MADENKPPAGQEPPKPAGDQTPPPAAPPAPPEAKPGEQKPAVKTDGPANGAPESYANFTLPEGLTLDATLDNEFKGAAKELNLTQDKAQKLVDLYAKHLKAQADGQIAEFEKMRAGWKAETAKALGANPERELAYAAKARDTFGSDEFARFMEETKLGDHPALTSFLVKVGKAISEDTLVEGSKPAAEKTLASALYGDNARK